MKRPLEEPCKPVTDRPLRVVCFGEVLWDCLPDGRKPGGAPCNVAYHLHKLGCEAQMISCVGRDALGDEMLAYLRSRGLSTELVRQHPTLPTGTVDVQLGPDGQPQYTIREEVAWDEITLTEEITRAVQECDAFVFGTLAARRETNRQTLDALLAIPGPLRLIDMNLRPPFDDHERAIALGRRADWIKLNEAELEQLTGRSTDHGLLAEAADVLREMTENQRMCITLGEEGAVLRQFATTLADKPPKVKVCDTVGAGDAFTAALIKGALTVSATESPNILRRALALGSLVASLPGAQPEYTAPDWVKETPAAPATV